MQRRPQVPLAQDALPLAMLGQALPQRPQFEADESADSQPLLARPSQLAKPAAQDTPHRPDAQVGEALGAPGQAAPQRPQLAAEVRVSVSHPFAAAPSQSAYSPAQVKPQRSPAQVAAVAFAGTAHAVDAP